MVDLSDEKLIEAKNKKISIIMSLIFLLICIGVGYAYYSILPPEDSKESLYTNTGTLSLKFNDNDNGVKSKLNLGETITKKFTIENTGSLNVYAKINWIDLVNTYNKESLSYTLEQSTTENGEYVIISKGNIPTSVSPLTCSLKDNILIPINQKFYYNLNITFNNLDINQNSDIDATFNSYFGLQEGSSSGVDLIKNLVKGANPSSTDVITNEVLSGNTCTNTLAYDGTVDNNLRYVGANPCNYVFFNNEIWRIIGVMNNVDDGTGKEETRIKLIRKDSLGNYSWDTSEYNINGGYGINDWTQADLMQELNGDYLNTSLTANTMWYNGPNNEKAAEYSYVNGLKETAQNLIGNAKWYLGGIDSDTYQQDKKGTANNFYSYERGNVVWGSTSGQTCNDGACPRDTSWTGKVALMYPSDYGFAVGNNRQYCLTQNIFNYISASCNTDNWLVPESWNRTITPSSDASNLNVGISNYSNNGVYTGYSFDTDDVKPVVYLKPNINFSSGNGSSTYPYIVD